jgi:hypothetical protein
MKREQHFCDNNHNGTREVAKKYIYKSPLKETITAIIDKALSSKLIAVPDEINLEKILILLGCLILSNLIAFGICDLFVYTYNDDIVFNIYNTIHIKYGLFLFWVGIFMLGTVRGILIYIVTPKIKNKDAVLGKIYYQLFKFAAVVFPFFSMLFLIVANKVISDMSDITVKNGFLSYGLACCVPIVMFWMLMFGAAVKQYLKVTFQLSETRLKLLA